MGVISALGRMLRLLVYVPPRRKTRFRERLLPWPVYGGTTLVLLTLLPFFLAGRLGESAEGSRVLGYVVVAPLACIGLLMTTLSWRLRRDRG